MKQLRSVNAFHCMLPGMQRCKNVRGNKKKIYRIYFFLLLKKVDISP